MKNLTILSLLFIMISCKSQIYTLGNSDLPFNIPTNSYIADTNNVLSKFTGIWKYQENGKAFIISLQKIKTDLGGYYKDMLKGYYKYTDGNLIIVDTSSYMVNESKLSGAWFKKNNSNKITLFFNDPERPKMSCEVTLTYSNVNGIEKLHWDLKLTGLISSRNPNMNPATDFRVPTSVELIKQ